MFNMLNSTYPFQNILTLKKGRGFPRPGEFYVLIRTKTTPGIEPGLTVVVYRY